jgi:hypothetical protein
MNGYRYMRAVAVASIAVGAAIAGVLASPMYQWTRVLAPRATDPVPILRVPDSPVTIGPDRPGGTARGEISIANAGAAELAFEITASCGCTDVEPRKGNILPSETRTIAISVRLPDVSGGEQAVTLTIASNDPDAPTQRVVAIAKCLIPFRTIPESINFGNICPDDLPNRSCVLSISDADGKRVCDGGVVTFRSANGNTKLSWQSGTPDECGVRVGIVTNAIDTDISDVIELRMPHSDIPVKIPVYAHIVYPVRAVPSCVFLHRGSDSSQPPSAKVIVVSDRPLGEFRTLDSIAGVALLEEKSNGATHFKTLRLTLNEPIAPARATLRIKFTNYEVPLTLTLLSLAAQ